jgi:hypothetical protein
VGAEVSGEDDLRLRYLGHVAHLANQMFSYGCLVLKRENNIISNQSKRYYGRIAREDKSLLKLSSVADPGCLSRIPDPDFYPSRITDPGSRITDLGSRIPKQQEKRGVKKICYQTFFCNHKFHKIYNYFCFEMLKKKIWVNFQRIMYQ